MKIKFLKINFLLRCVRVKIYFITFFICTCLTLFGQNTIYVNSMTGVDATGDGTSGSPFKTFHKAYTMSANGDTIDLTGTFTWTDADETGDTEYIGYTISKNLTIQGQDPNNTIIQADPSPNTADRRVFNISNNRIVTFKNLMIRHGRAWSGWIGMTLHYYNGAAIGCSSSESGANITLDNVLIDSNYAVGSSSGGVFITGTFSATNCTFQNNTSTSLSSASAIALSLYLDQTYSKKTRNITNCTFYNNTSSSSDSPAVYVDRTGANFINNTFLNNTNAIKGYAMNYINSKPELNIVNCILANSAGYDLKMVLSDDFGAKCTNSIVEVEQIVAGEVTYISSFTGDQTLLNVSMATSNAGNANLTPYIELDVNSVAIDAGVTGDFGSVESGGIITVPLTDQRGASRIGNTDIGAYEFGAIVDTTAPVITLLGDDLLLSR